MNIYKVITRKRKDQPHWEDGNLLVIASDYGNAEDKAKNFFPASQIVSIVVYGSTTGKKDVFILSDR